MLIHITFGRYGFCAVFWRSVWGRYGMNWSLVYANSYNIWSNSQLQQADSMEEEEEGEKLSEDDISTDECDKKDSSEEEGT